MSALPAAQDAVFVFTKPGTEAGESLIDIAARKEAERIAGKNVFWWGVGSSLGDDLSAAAQKAGGALSLIFIAHDRPSPSKPEDLNPARVVRWTKWKTRDGRIADVPAFAKVTSRWDDKKRLHYALVCISDAPLSLDSNGPRFDPLLCKTFAKERAPGTSQVTALVRGNLSDPRHQDGRYRILFRARLVVPSQARLVEYR
jgi:hypothetical protein